MRPRPVVMKESCRSARGGVDRAWRAPHPLTIMALQEEISDNKRALDALRRIVRMLRVTDRDVERRLGISVAQLFVLELLVDHGPSSIGDLAAATMTDPSSVSVVVKRLVDAGLASRDHSPQDARRAVIAATSTGRKTLAQAPEAPQGRLVTALEELSADEQRCLAAALWHVADTMGRTGPAFFFEDEHGKPPRGASSAAPADRPAQSERPASPGRARHEGRSGAPTPAGRRTARGPRR